MRLFLFLVITIFINTSILGQCTKLKYYPPKFEKIEQTVKVSDGYEKVELVKAGYYKNEKKTIVVKEGYIDYKKGCAGGYECSYEPYLVEAETRVINNRVWIAPVYKTTYIEPVYRTIIKQYKIENAKVIQVVVDCD